LCLLNEAHATSSEGPATLSARGRADTELTGVESQILDLRRHLHRHPELSGKEFATTAFLGEQLSALGLSVSPGPEGLGIVSDLPATSGLPIIALRADIDALPIQETTALPFRSEVPGVMHACGHDAHAAMLFGALTALHRAAPLPAPCRGIFQSSEEAGQGALDLVQAGVLQGVGMIIALHVDPNLPVGSIGITAGPQTACCQDFSIQIKGRGGHAARPHLSIDPIAIGSQLVTQIYQFIPRMMDLRNPAVVTIGQFEGGHCANVIPDAVSLRGTIRALDRSVAEETRQRLVHLCEGAAAASGARVEIAFSRLLPGVVNDPAITAACVESARELVGTERLVLTSTPSMGAEDFADYLTVVPGCMMRLGVASPNTGIRPLHTPTFEIEESALLVGARLLVRSFLRLAHSIHHAH
jgi:amidohydrolase